MKHLKNKKSEVSASWRSRHSLLTAENIEARWSVWLNGNPSLLTAKNIQAGRFAYLYNCPSLLELSTTVEAGKTYVSFNL